MHIFTLSVFGWKLIKIWQKCSQGESGHDLQKLFQKGAWPESRDPLNFSALNANVWTTIKATDLKFDKNVPRDSPDITPKKNFQKGAYPGSRYP